MSDPISLSTILAVLSPFVAAALSYGGMRVSVKSLQANMTEVTKKLSEVEKDVSKRVSDLEKDKVASTSMANMEVKVSNLELAVATVKGSHEELSRRHADGMTEVRTRASALEGRTSSLEQNNAELRAQLQSVIQTAARIEAKQDREAESFAELRRDFLEFFAGDKSNTRTRTRTKD